LSDELARSGFEIFCFKGSGATFPGPGEPCHLSLFNTNDDLLGLLERASVTHEIAAVFHVAALCDYKVRCVQDDQGRSCVSPKIASRSGALTISLEPATKVITKMRGMFPQSILVGWKYELTGTPEEAVAKAGRQMRESQTDACVLNGQAWGSSFALCQPSLPIRECRNKTETVQFLTAWVTEKLRQPVA
jgi:hypothetical protein